jgi:hypothetical protein
VEGGDVAESPLEEVLEALIAEAKALTEGETRVPSRYAGPYATRDAVLSAGGGADLGGRVVARSSVSRDVVGLFRDLKGVAVGDPDAVVRLRRGRKAFTGSDLLFEPERLPGYVPARTAAAPIRGLATEHEINGREAHVLIDNGDLLVTDWTPESGLKPPSSNGVSLVVATLLKAAGITIVPDELLADSEGLALELITRSFGVSIGKTIDVALLDGTGIGQPLGVLRDPDVAHTTIGASEVAPLFDALAAAVSRLRIRLYGPTAIAMRPELLLRFVQARSTTGTFLFEDMDAVATRLGAPIVVDANVPVVAGLTSAIVADWRSALLVVSNGGVVIESSTGPMFPSDETAVRCFERIGAAVIAPAAVEVIDGIEVNP